MNTDIQKLISDLSAKGKSYSNIATVLVTMDHAKNKTEANKLLDEAGIQKTAGKRGITDRMYDFLAEEKRTKEELEAWVKEHGTANTLRWLSTHQKVRELVNRVRDEVAAKSGVVTDTVEVIEITEPAETDQRDVISQITAFNKLPKHEVAA